MSFLDPSLDNGKRSGFHLVDLPGGIGTDVMIVDPSALSHVDRGFDEARFFSECEDAKRNKHASNGAISVARDAMVTHA